MFILSLFPYGQFDTAYPHKKTIKEYFTLTLLGLTNSLD